MSQAVINEAIARTMAVSLSQLEVYDGLELLKYALERGDEITVERREIAVGVLERAMKRLEDTNVELMDAIEPLIALEV